MSAVHRFRMSMVKYLGKTITPEVAAAIEAEAFSEPERSIDPMRFAPKVYRGLVFAIEGFRDISGELQALHEAHWQETERARAGLALRPRYEYLNAADRRGELLQVTARENGALVGHARFYLFDDIHTSTRGAKEDAFFLQPQVRRGFNAIRLWQYAERCLADLGVLEVRTDSKVLHDAEGNVIRNVGRLNEFLGYQHVSNGYLKRLTKE